MENKLLFICIAALFVGLVFMSGCTKPETSTSHPSEYQENTNETTADYFSCMKASYAYTDRDGWCDHDACKADKLVQKGYTDGVGCYEGSENPVCTTERYNAEVEAYNECVAQCEVAMDACNNQ